MMTEIWLIRHGLTDSNANKIIQGQLDVPLNELGRTQAKYLGDRLNYFLFRHCLKKENGINEIGSGSSSNVEDSSKYIVEDMETVAYSSDLCRAYETATISLGGKIPVKTHQGLREMDFGPISGRGLTQLPLGQQKAFQLLLSGDPDVVFLSADHSKEVSRSESLREVQSRVTDAVQEILKENKGKRILLFSHGIAIKMYIANAMGWTITQGYLGISTENTSISRILIPHHTTKVSPSTSIRLLSLNDCAHLHLTNPRESE
eukprot:TRINITY_DN8034_c0_g2_i2.p1 TRINITY_DN8034_c0_g2~~TRINITY_DN8034_c0_g2_i2.p1  ORF type:complete len:261 (+),score=32.36 TRINITY_DN8034_c0_g2_i2:927-1709(+)